MPITIVETVGAANANSFVSEAEMTAYCDARLNATIWTDAAAQLPALVEATRELSLLLYVGSRTDSTQALSWPRVYAPDPDAPWIEQIGDALLAYFADDEVPQRVKDATCELALQFLLAGTTDLASADPNQGVVRKKVDVLETEWASPQSRASGLSRFPRVLALVGPMLETTGGGLTLERV